MSSPQGLGDQHQWLEFENKEALEKALCTTICNKLKNKLATGTSPSLMVSGGSTPLGLFKKLSEQQLNWSKVHIGLVDERWVAPDHADSNEKLLRKYLLKNQACAAKFQGLKTAADTPEQGITTLLHTIPSPITTIVLGMGDDGHTASWFPGAKQLDRLYSSADALGFCLPPVAPHPRATLTLSAVLASEQLILHITGDKKRSVFENALIEHDPRRFPICAVLNQYKTPLSIYWSP
jgi:6-phosphogluconolactonase